MKTYCIELHVPGRTFELTSITHASPEWSEIIPHIFKRRHSFKLPEIIGLLALLGELEGEICIIPKN